MAGIIISEPIAGVIMTAPFQWIASRARAAEFEKLSESELLKLFVEHNDGAAFEELLRKYGPRVLSICCKILGPCEDADDVFQAVFISLSRNAGNIRNGDSLGSWLSTVAVNAAKKARSARSKRKDHPGDIPEVADPRAYTGKESEILFVELERLPKQLREPIERHYLEGRTHEQAAVLLGISVATLKRKINKGISLLSERLETRGFGHLVMALLTLATPRLLAAVPPTLVKKTLKICVEGSPVPNSVGQLAGPLTLSAFGLSSASFYFYIKIGCLLVLVASVSLSVASPRNNPKLAMPLTTAPNPILERFHRDVEPRQRKSLNSLIQKDGLVKLDAATVLDSKLRFAYTIFHTPDRRQNSISRFVSTYDVNSRKDDTYIGLLGRPLASVDPSSMLFRTENWFRPGSDLKLGLKPFEDAVAALKLLNSD
jgi:RNA polymerase sigma factor (sigma-70 family)